MDQMDQMGQMEIIILMDKDKDSILTLDLQDGVIKVLTQTHQIRIQISCQASILWEIKLPTTTILINPSNHKLQTPMG